jgi:hypothetical protein
MSEYTSPKVKEGWTGPGRSDGEIMPLVPEDDALHIEVGKRGLYEWWYFDAHLDGGHTIVVFFYAANPNPGMAGKIGVEIVLLRPDGKKTQIFIPYRASDFSASREKPEVSIGANYMKVRKGKNGLPEYEIFIKEKDLGCHLIYNAEVNGWKPGSGYSHFGDMGYFAWVIPFARASVKGTVTDGGAVMQAKGIGYHDHNWLNFQFARIIDYWMWGRVYSRRYTVSYAYIQCNKKMDNHTVKVLMLADGKKVIASTGDFQFLQDEHVFNAKAGHRYPQNVAITVPGMLNVALSVEKVLEAVDMLEKFNPLLRFLAKMIGGIKPGYFRLLSRFTVAVTGKGKTIQEKGKTLHEIVLLKPSE